ncbi:TraM recognition domain-containing protein [Isoptericola rhizosphaerae]|uniref:TraM recognition domain-containing protein n=1 Tax=Isoptericola rhizosphaerae TaxID=3377837 RepID=UPI00383BB1E8
MNDAAALRPRRSTENLIFIAVLWLLLAATLAGTLLHAVTWAVATVTSRPVPDVGDTLNAVRASPTNPVAGYTDAPGSPALIYTLVAVVVVTLLVGGVWLALTVAGRIYDLRTNRATPRTHREMRERAALAKAGETLAATPAAEQFKSTAKGRPVSTELLVPVGSLRGKHLYAQHEDSVLGHAPPRSGKSMFLVVPWILDAPGPVVATGTKNDVVFLTAAAREEKGTVHVLDFDDITGWPETLQWNPVMGCADPDEAIHRGRAWASAEPIAGTGGNSEWFKARAGEVLAYLMHAAALKPGGNMGDVVRWAADFNDNEPVRILRDQGTSTIQADPREDTPAASAAEPLPIPAPVDFGTQTWADLLTARTQSAAGDTTGSLQMTLSGVLAPLTSPKVLRSVCPSGRGFDVEEFLDGSNTLYLLSSDGAGNVAPLITALADTVVRAAKTRSQKSPGGRLWPPLRLVLEEAANVAPLPNLPGLMSDSGGRGITTMVIVQSHAQMIERWGRSGADAIRAAATVHLYLPGIKESDVLKELSDRTDRYRARRYSHSSGGQYGGSTSTSSEWENVMTPEAIRKMDVGTGLLVYRALKAAHVNLPTPWWKREDRKTIAAGLKTIEERTGRRMDP